MKNLTHFFKFICSSINQHPTILVLKAIFHPKNVSFFYIINYLFYTYLFSHQSTLWWKQVLMHGTRGQN